MVNINSIKLEVDKKELNNLISKLKKFDNDINKAGKEIVKEMANYIENETKTNLDNTVYKDGNNDAIAYSLLHSDNSAEAGMKGTQVLYDEFGTGTEGANSPHPLKDASGLSSYNSGRTIREANPQISIQSGVLPGEKYWTYIGEDGQIVYTQGIPAGMQVFNANESLKKSKQDIIEKKVGEVISKL